MYLANRSSPVAPTSGVTPGKVATTTVLLGIVSLLTDVSSEAVTAVLPLYLTAALGMSPLAYGFIDGIYQGISAVVRIAAGRVADRGDHPKWVAFLGYGLSAIARLALLVSQGFAAVTGVITVDRLGKGIRTAPRDAMIAAGSPADAISRNFGVHRALDTVGAMLGPLIAFVILAMLPGDYRSVFIVSFAFALVGLAVLGLIVPDVRPRREASTASPDAVPDSHAQCRIQCRDCAWAQAISQARTSDDHPRPMLSLLRQPALRRIVIVAGALGLLTVGDGFLYLILQRRSDFASAYFPLLYVGTSAAYLLLSVPMGRLADRYGKARVFVLGHVPLALAFVFAALPFASSAWVIATVGLLGVYYAATDGVLAALTSRSVAVSNRASGIATVQTIVAFARFCSSLGFGLLWVSVGPSMALVLVLTGLLLALPFAWRWLVPLDVLEQHRLVA